MLLTTTNSVEGKTISTYYGMVSGEAIIGANIFKDFFASITDIVGGRSGAYEKSLKDAKNIAIKEMIDAAGALGANAIIAIDLDYETVGKDSGMLMVSASGTAVTIDQA
ncbi:MAG: heavy metal-binding domain-containing protein [Bacteroidota bacterium]